jgi:hypothetical protein
MTYKCEFHYEVEKDYSEAYEWYESQKERNHSYNFHP